SCAFAGPAVEIPLIVGPLGASRPVPPRAGERLRVPSSRVGVERCPAVNRTTPVTSRTTLRPTPALVNIKARGRRDRGDAGHAVAAGAGGVQVGGRSVCGLAFG